MTHVHKDTTPACIAVHLNPEGLPQLSPQEWLNGLLSVMTEEWADELSASTEIHKNHGARHATEHVKFVWTPRTPLAASNLDAVTPPQAVRSSTPPGAPRKPMKVSW